MKGNIALLLIICSISGGVFAQTKRAEREVEKCNYPKAIEFYNKSWKKDQFNDHIIRQLGDLYIKTDDYTAAERWYAKLYENGYATTKDFYTYLKILNYNKKYRSVEKILGKISTSDRERVESYFLTNKQLSEPKRNVSLKKVPLNDNNSALFPSYYSDNRLVFMSDKETSVMVNRKDAITDRPYLNAFLAKINPKGNEVIGDIKLFSTNVKSKFNDGPICFSKDGKEVYYSTNIKEKNKEGKIRYALKLYVLKKSGDVYGEPELLPFNETGYSYSHPALSPDDRTLFFASNMAGGFGGSDIYKVEKEGNGWGQPENLGKGVNTIDDEIAPFMNTNEQMYFSSRGLPGYGGYDLFVKNLNDTLKAQNLGRPINTSKDDFSIILRGSQGYISSNREEMNQDDIFYFYAHEDLVKKEIVKVEKKEVVVVNKEVDVLKVGSDLTKTFNLKPILYEFNSSDLTKEACEELDKVVDILNTYTDMQIDLRAHTDSRGADWHNRKLSDERASSAIKYLRARIISPFRVTGRGYGESQLLNHCSSGVKCSDEDHAINRRTEFIIIKVR